MFKVNDKNTRYLSGVFVANFEQGVSIVNFEHLIAGRPYITLDCFTYTSDYSLAPQFCTLLKMKVFVKEVNVKKFEKKAKLFTFTNQIFKGKLRFLFSVSKANINLTIWEDQV